MHINIPEKYRQHPWRDSWETACQKCAHTHTHTYIFAKQYFYMRNSYLLIKNKYLKFDFLPHTNAFFLGKQYSKLTVSKQYFVPLNSWFFILRPSVLIKLFPWTMEHRKIVLLIVCFFKQIPKYNCVYSPQMVYVPLFALHPAVLASKPRQVAVVYRMKYHPT